ncbi:unnamed protein product [Clavelina lepadiformis]|uniref:Uncharacterized protein n=1 Tax=Clavelina lepadiformis TaxID=159417 RepID=A0ABP0FAE4_CLALP
MSSFPNTISIFFNILVAGSSSNKKNNTELSLGVIIGNACGVALILLCIATIAIVRWKRRPQEKNRDEDGYLRTTEVNQIAQSEGEYVEVGPAEGETAYLEMKGSTSDMKMKWDMSTLMTLGQSHKEIQIMLSQKETAICVKCRKGYRTGDSLCHVGAYFCESDSTTHPLDTIIGHALKLDCETLVATLQKNKENGHITCMFDERHPDRNKFEEVRTKSSGIYYVTLALCQSRDDELAKTVQARLLSAHDLVAAEARYHVEQGLKILHSIQHLVVQHPLKK